MWKMLLEARANRVVNSPEVHKTIVVEDAEEAVVKMVNDRKPKVDPDEIQTKMLTEKMLREHMKPMGKLQVVLHLSDL